MIEILLRIRIFQKLDRLLARGRNSLKTIDVSPETKLLDPGLSLDTIRRSREPRQRGWFDRWRDDSEAAQPLIAGAGPRISEAIRKLEAGEND
jgi:hypothetical protein